MQQDKKYLYQVSMNNKTKLFLIVSLLNFISILLKI